MQHNCRWCKDSFTTSQGRASHERGKHEKEYWAGRANGKGKSSRNTVQIISDDPANHLKRAMESLIARRAHLQDELNRQSDLQTQLSDTQNQIEVLEQAQSVFNKQ